MTRGRACFVFVVLLRGCGGVEARGVVESWELGPGLAEVLRFRVRDWTASLTHYNDLRVLFINHLPASVQPGDAPDVGSIVLAGCSSTPSSPLWAARVSLHMTQHCLLGGHAA
jgi:hypothetical protein